MAADFNLDGHTDLYVTSAGYNDATTRCSGTTGTGRSPKAPSRRASTRTAGTRPPPSATSTATDGRISSSSVYRSERPSPTPRPASHPTTRRVRDLLYLNKAPTRTGTSTFREVARAGRHREDEARARARRDLHRLQPRRPSRPVRRERRGSQPALRERRAEGRRRGDPGPRLPPRGRRRNARRRRPERGHGNRGRRLHGRRTDRHLRHQLARPAARRLPEPPGRRRPVVRRRARRVRSCSRLAPRGMGCRRGPTWTSTAISTSSWRTARSPS